MMETTVDVKKRIQAELTPDMYRCAGGVAACPSVFETDHGTLLVIGRILDDDTRKLLPEGRVGEGEIAIEIPKGMITNIDFS